MSSSPSRGGQSVEPSSASNDTGTQSIHSISVHALVSMGLPTSIFASVHITFVDTGVQSTLHLHMPMPTKSMPMLSFHHASPSLCPNPLNVGLQSTHGGQCVCIDPYMPSQFSPIQPFFIRMCASIDRGFRSATQGINVCASIDKNTSKISNST